MDKTRWFSDLSEWALGLFLLLALLLPVGCSDSTDSAKVDGQPEKILAERARVVFSSVGRAGSAFPDNLISGPQLLDILTDPQAAKEVFLLDTRPAREWRDDGHIKGAVSIGLQEIAGLESLDLLPHNKRIICLSSTGHTAVQAASVLRWLGYEAIVLKHGMAGLLSSQARGMMLADLENGMTKRYSLTRKSDNPASPDRSPVVGTFTGPRDSEFEILRSAADKLMRNNIYGKEYPFNHIFADRLYRRLNEPKGRDRLFLLDIREAPTRKEVGHIEGSVNIFWPTLAEPENLKKLPKDKLIVVLANTGQTAGQVTPILKMMGFDAVTLRSGLTAWAVVPESEKSLAVFNNPPDFGELIVKGD